MKQLVGPFFFLLVALVSPCRAEYEHRTDLALDYSYISTIIKEADGTQREGRVLIQTGIGVVPDVAISATLIPLFTELGRKLSFERPERIFFGIAGQCLATALKFGFRGRFPLAPAFFFDLSLERTPLYRAEPLCIDSGAHSILKDVINRRRTANTSFSGEPIRGLPKYLLINRLTEPETYWLMYPKEPDPFAEKQTHWHFAPVDSARSTAFDICRSIVEMFGGG